MNYGARVVDLLDGYLLLVLEGDVRVVSLVDCDVVIEEGGGRNEVEGCHGWGRRI